jgi:hypothetical protein
VCLSEENRGGKRTTQQMVNETFTPEDKAGAKNQKLVPDTMHDFSSRAAY